MKVGDMVRWKPHNYWPCGGLGLVLEVNEQHKEFFAFWFSDVEDYGSWAEAMKAATWYGCSDLEEDIEVLNESR
jgi:hypothetical protein